MFSPAEISALHSASPPPGCFQPASLPDVRSHYVLRTRHAYTVTRPPLLAAVPWKLYAALANGGLHSTTCEYEAAPHAWPWPRHACNAPRDIATVCLLPWKCMYLLPVFGAGPCQRCGETLSRDRQGSPFVYRDPPSERLQGSGAARYPRGSAGGPEHQQLVPCRVLTLAKRSGSGALRWPFLCSSRLFLFPLWSCLKRGGREGRDPQGYPGPACNSAHFIWYVYTYIKYIHLLHP